ncbi:MAG TPA: GNVR domain-containing protein [Bryobacteraceae bacterium]|nr:GNVR domain-containing protein [Bryobacteraceae bacterium]
MLDRLSVPRRPFDFEDYIDILRRNIRWIVAPAFAGLVLSTVVAFFLPDTFMSQALVRIVPQQINPNMVQSVTSQDLADRISGMAQTIESRDNLTSLITKYGLYKSELKREPMEDVVNEMKKAIEIRPTAGIAGGSLPALQVSFKYNDRNVAQRVCQDLVTTLMNEGAQGTLEAQSAAQQYFQAEVKQAQKDLSDIEQKLTQFRMKNAGRLPDEVQLNMNQVNNLENRLGSLGEASNRNTQERMMLETQFNIAKERLNAIKDGAPQRNERLMELDRTIQNLQTQIAQMKQRYTPDFPDLQTAEQQLGLYQRQRDEVAHQAATRSDIDSTEDNSTLARERLEAQAQIKGLQVQLDANKMDAKQIKTEVAATNAALKNYESRLESAPIGEQEYTELMRDHNLAKQRYDKAQLDLQKAVISMDLQQRKQGETLELLDSASLPATPTAPKRQMIIPLGLFAGLILGLVLVVMRELKDTSLKNLKDARLYTQLSILGSIPLLENDLVVQRRKQIMWVGWATAALAGLAIMGLSVARYYIHKA